jgi:methylphosphotriester-DNA--protein-cysteine methyltransferase
VIEVVRKDVTQLASSAASGSGESAMQVVAKARHYFGLHLQEPIEITALPNALGISEDCLNSSFDQVRGMTPAQALLEQRLNKLFAALTDQPRQGLKHAIQCCGLDSTAGVVPLFEQTFGIDMPLFLLTCRRAADDRSFRRDHPEPEALVLPI